MRITWDEGCCASLGMCEEAAPELFAIGDDGALQVLDDEPDPEQEVAAREAVRACPTGALQLLD